MPPPLASPIDTDILDALNNVAIVEENVEHINCQVAIFKVLESKNVGRVPPFKFTMRRDPMKTGNGRCCLASFQFDDPSKTPTPSLKQPALAKLLNQLEQFTCFEQLIPELREKIWNHALPGPQIIELYRNKTAIYNGQMPQDISKILITLLTTCLESYEVVKRHYTCMGFDVGTVQTIKYPTILVRPNIDILYFTAVDQVILNMAQPPSHLQASWFTTIAMPAAVFRHFIHRREYFKFMLWISLLIDLKTILLVCRESHEEHGEEITFGDYTGAPCVHQDELKKTWADLTKDIDQDISLVWVQPYRNGVLAKGAFCAH